MPTWECRPEDREFFERELADFVPDRVYDMGCHLWRRTDWQGREDAVVKIAPAEMTRERYAACMDWIMPGREIHSLFFPFPATFPNDPTPCNAWISEQIKGDPLARGQFYVRPTDDPEWTRAEIKRLGLRGFKPFAGFSGRPDIANAEIPEFCPEWIPRLAHEEGWSITLHMMRARSLADPSNQHWVSEYCRKYPNMTLILDHCMRGFNPHHLREGLARLPHFANLYADLSLTCTALAVATCIKHLGISQVVYASDFYCSHFRGTNLPVGDSFLWLSEDMPIWDQVVYGAKPVLQGLENLRAIKAACRLLDLSDNDVEAIFWGNAERVLRL
ncbi:MAG: amidohydrolase family protein [Kiritimatiellaeota bacterium]|nr:amidohydrolase family protein [Kiritimatiellota bacterium]